MKKVVIALIVVIAALLAAFFLLVPPSKGELEQFRNENGEIMENSISERVKLEIEGYEVQLTIQGMDKNSPVLLLCGGGPGIPQTLLEYLYPSRLPERFVVCNFDYVGCGNSYTKLNPEAVTTRLLIDEALMITDYLKERFNQQKIYIMGHSFGSFIALNAVYEHPEDYIAYFAMAQTCDQKRSEVMAFEHMKELYRESGNERMVKKMEKFDIENSEEDYKKYRVAGLRDKAMHELGVGTTRDMDSVISGLFLPSLRCKELTIGQRLDLWKGKIQSSKFAADIGNFNAFEEIKKLEVPIYFFGGEYDYTCCIDLQKEYYEYIEAPKKEFFLYEGVSHSPIYEDGIKTLEIMDKLLEENEK